jgi:methyl-accepting chemotaxis protein
MMKTKLSLSIRLTAIIGVFALLIGIMVAATYLITSAQERDVVFVNVAGRQRMLTQRLTKASLGYVTELREQQEAEKIADLVVLTRAHAAKSIARAKQAGVFKLTEDTLDFTPASSARQITAEFSKGKQMILRQVSRKYRNPDNKPDAYEDQALARMEREPEKWRNKSWSEKVVKGDKATMRYLRPMFITKACLGCHSDPASVPEFIREKYPNDLATGYREGDLRGAISVSWPTRIMPIEDHRAEFTQTRDLFDKTLTGLIDGGTTTFGGEELTLPRCDDDGIRAQLNLVSGLWTKIADAADTIFSDKLSDEAVLGAALDFLVMNNSELLVEMNKAVGMFQANVDARGVFLRRIQFCSIIVALGVFAFVIYFVRSGITRPIKAIIAGLTEGAEQVSSASGQVSSASQSLAEGATEQAAGLEETSSSLEEMSSMTKQNADNAQQANTLAAEARKAADNGSQSMIKMNEAIEEIQKSSDETAKIIKVIDEIAFQTNLLALNAAVEAARAGEAGKGFAVVAEEVRNLAMRSAEAAKNTANMIEESVKNSKNGVDIATEVGKVLEEIVSGIGKTSDLVGEIAAASQEQAQGIDQVNTAMAQMDKVTQQNAANAEESASASEELSAQAAQMNGIVGELAALVGGSTGNTTVASAARARPSEQHQLGRSDHVFHHVAGGGNQRAKTKVAARATAEKMIPLSDDDCDDLREFNS